MDRRVTLYRKDFEGNMFEWVLKDLNIPVQEWPDIKSVELSVDAFCINDGELKPKEAIKYLFRQTILDYLKAYKYLTPESQDEIDILSYRLYNIVVNAHRVEDYEEYILLVEGGKNEKKKRKKSKTNE